MTSWVKVPVRRRQLAWFVGVGVMVTLFIARPLLAADLSGRWEISSRYRDVRQTVTLDLVQHGSSVTGSGMMTFSTSDDVIPVVVRSGTARTGNFRITLSEASAAGRPPQEYSGDWYRDEMSGKTTGGFGVGMFSGVRLRPQSPKNN